MRELLITELEDIGGILILDMPDLFDLYPVENYYNQPGDKLGHIP